MIMKVLITLDVVVLIIVVQNVEKLEIAVLVKQDMLWLMVYVVFYAHKKMIIVLISVSKYALNPALMESIMTYKIIPVQIV